MYKFDLNEYPPDEDPLVEDPLAKDLVVENPPAKDLVVENPPAKDHLHGLIFSPEELKGIDVIRAGEDFIEVVCGCTNKKFGDFDGKLRIYGSGKLEISCECSRRCNGAIISPSEFEKHARLKGQSNWKTRVWVSVDKYKVPLRKTKLLKYFKGSIKDRSVIIRPCRYQKIHRDELMTCTACGKERRFLLPSKADCKLYHLAYLAKEHWTCSDYPHKVFRCEDEEERKVAKKIRGCPRKKKCKGCTSCVCFGCSMCRFEECNCRSCVDFIQNIEI